MKDTSEKMEAMHRRMIMARSGEERIEMCLSMLGMAKEIIKSTIKNKNHWREELFLRLYGNDFDEKTKTKILQSLRDRSKIN